MEKDLQETPQLRVMSWNFWIDHPRHPAWAGRRDRAASLLRYHRPEVLGGQELSRRMLDDLSERLPEYRWVGAAREDGAELGEITAIMYRLDRVELVRHQTFWLSPCGTHQQRGWDAACKRTVTWAELRERRSGRVFFVFNTHFDHYGGTARRESARMLLQKVQELAVGHPVLVTGDFNFRHKSISYGIMTAPESGLRDAFHHSQSLPHGPRKTWRGLWCRGIGSDRIDYIFVNERVVVEQYAALADRAEGGFASDHLPVVIEATLHG